MDDRLKPRYMTWLFYCKRKKKRIIYTYDCNEKMYPTIGVLTSLDPKVTIVGSPKAGQNRNYKGGEKINLFEKI